MFVNHVNLQGCSTQSALHCIQDKIADVEGRFP
jgi:hypothetical protein